MSLKIYNQVSTPSLSLGEWNIFVKQEDENAADHGGEEDKGYWVLPLAGRTSLDLETNSINIWEQVMKKNKFEKMSLLFTNPFI